MSTIITFEGMLLTIVCYLVKCVEREREREREFSSSITYIMYST